MTSQAYQKASCMARVTIVIVLSLLLAKTWLYIATGAASFLASLVDSGMDLALSGATFLAIQWASKPADDNHRYGHGKMEALISFVQFLVVSGAALALAVQAGHRFSEPQILDPTTLEIGVTLAICVANIGLVYMQGRVIRETGSLAIRGDQAHYASDLFGNAGLLVLLAVNHFLSVPWLDPLLTLTIAAILLSAAGQIGRDSMNTLLDHEAPACIRDALMNAALRTGGVHNVHDLRVIESGMRLIVSLDIEVDGHQSLTEAHDISRLVESALLKVAPNAEIMIHIDPLGDVEDSRHENLEPHHFS